MARLINPLSIVLTESHLNDNILSAEVSIPGYTLYRSDRVGHTQGDTCSYMRDDLATQLLLSCSNSVCESLILKVKTLNLFLGTIYRPPDSSLTEFEDAINVCKEGIDRAMEDGQKLTIILQLGNYNFPFISWPVSQYIKKVNKMERSSPVKRSRRRCS